MWKIGWLPQAPAYHLCFKYKHTSIVISIARCQECAGRSFFQRGGARTKSAGRGGAKERVNRLIQKFENSAYIVMEIFVVYYDVLINENISSSHF